MLINQGKYFPQAAINGGYIFIAFGIIGSTENVFIGIPIILLGIYLSFSTSGIEIDIDNKKFRDYAVYFGLRKGGKWRDLSKYPDLCLLKTRESTTTFARSNASVTYKDNYYDLFLMTSTHRSKVFIERFKNKDSAHIKARELERILGKELKTYSPNGSIPKNHV